MVLRKIFKKRTTIHAQNYYKNDLSLMQRVPTKTERKDGGHDLQIFFLQGNFLPAQLKLF